MNGKKSKRIRVICKQITMDKGHDDLDNKYSKLKLSPTTIVLDACYRKYVKILKKNFKAGLVNL